MKKILETERLLIREFILEDADFIYRLLNSPGWLKFIGDRHVHDLTAAEQYIVNVLMKNYAEQEFGFWHVLLKKDYSSIGMCGLIKRDYLDAPDIGYALLPDFEGQGYAGEAAMATLNYAIQTLKLNPIIAITDTANQRSISLLEKLGMVFQKTVFMPITNKEANVFSTIIKED